VRPRLPAILILIACAALAGGVSTSMAPQPRAALDPARPNVVLIVTDDQSYDQLSTMKRVNGRTDWVRFTNTYFENALCCPSRATILTGQYDFKTGVTRLNGEAFKPGASLATWFKARHYRTGLVGKYLNGYPFGKGLDYVPPGWDSWHAYKNDGNLSPDYFNYALSVNGVRKNFGSRKEEYSTDVFKAKALSFIDSSVAAQKPFFLYFAPYASHAPRTPAPRHANTFANAAPVVRDSLNHPNTGKHPYWASLPPRNSQDMHAERRQAWRTAQAADEAIAALFAKLETSRQLDNTIVIFTTDNGYAYGEHRWHGKTCQYDPCNRTTMLVRAPGVAGKTITAPVSNADIAPTVTDLADLDPTLSFDGQSLRPLLSGASLPPTWRNAVLLHSEGGGEGNAEKASNVKPDFWGVRSSRYKYVETKYPEPHSVPSRCAAPTGPGTFCELYDMQTDPDELTNLAGTPAAALIQAEHARLLRSLRGW
jgi:N-acetylglucosamine-6-sulfatase